MSYTPNNAWDRSPQTGLASNPGPFLAEVMKNDDPLYSGRLLVYIPDFGGDPEQESSWHLVRYMTPYYGIQPISNRLAAESTGVTESYGMWMTPPDLGVKVLVMFINGDRSKGVWIGCLPEIGSHGAIPGNDKGDFDIYENQSAANNDIKSIPRPEHSTAPTFATQGLENDAQRGKPITTSSLRESPTKVFGMNTPSGHSFFMDDGAEDGTNKMLRMRTAAGNMIMMNDDTGFVYIINAKGTGWIELSPNGFVDIYGEQGVSIGTPGNIDMHAAGNINMHAGQNIKMVAEKEAKFQGTEQAKIYGGDLYLQGSDSLHMYSCGMIHSTGSKGMHFKSEKEFVLEGRIFKWNSGSAREADQVAPDAPEAITGYTSTVLRAPNREPWQGHDESYEETPRGNLSGDIATDNPLDAFGGAGDPVIGLDAFGGIGDAISTVTDPLDAFGGIGDAISTVTDNINVLPEKLRQGAYAKAGVTGDILQIEKQLKDQGIDRIDIKEIDTVIKSGNNQGAAAFKKVAENIDVTNVLSTTRTNDSSFISDISNAIGTVGNTFDQVNDIRNIAGQINLKDLSIGNVANTINGVGQLANRLNIDSFSVENLLPASPLVTNALSIRSNIRNAENLIGQIAAPLTSLNAIKDTLDFDGSSGLVGTINKIDQLTRLPANIENFADGVDTLLGSGIGNFAGGIGDLAGGVVGGIEDIAGGVVGGIEDIAGGVVGGIEDIAGGVVGGLEDFVGDFAGSIGDFVDGITGGIDPGKINEVLTDLPVSVPSDVTDLIPPDVGDALSDAKSVVGNLDSTQASSIIPATPGGGVAPSSAIGSDCTTPVTRGNDTPANQQQNTEGNAGNAYSGAPANVVPPEDLANDPEWQAELANLKQRFPELDEGDLYRVIQGESRFNSTVVNRDSGATGLFQFIPSTARGLGTSTAEIQQMTPAEQLKVYGNYLGQFNYSGGPLGIMQAAPGTYSNLIRRFGGSYSNVPGNYEVYSTSSAAWRQNPGWRGPDGRITINSINSYYGRQR